LGRAAAVAIVVVLAMLGGSAPALAVDGVIDINSAVVGSNFPFSITQSGSYRLTGNLTVPSAKDGIDVTADDVTIDLNGFAIIGSAGGVGNGSSSSNSEVTVRNGSITGMGGNGIVLGNNATVADVHAIGNGGNGIEIGNAGLGDA